MQVGDGGFQPDLVAGTDDRFEIIGTCIIAGVPLDDRACRHAVDEAFQPEVLGGENVVESAQEDPDGVLGLVGAQLGIQDDDLAGLVALVVQAVGAGAEYRKDQGNREKAFHTCQKLRV